MDGHLDSFVLFDFEHEAGAKTSLLIGTRVCVDNDASRCPYAATTPSIFIVKVASANRKARVIANSVGVNPENIGDEGLWASIASYGEWGF